MARRVREPLAQYGEVHADARLRAKNQLTIPDEIVRAAELAPGDTFSVVVDPAAPDLIRLRRLRESYAGAFADLYGDVESYLEEERASWERD
jgi:bifunctional DNA-binding transcriptional regulator/antitoxin component of YhaV-PrlF toxin-antitoxin module